MVVFNDVRKDDAGIYHLMDAGFNKSNPTRIAIDAFVVKETIDEASDIFRFARMNNIFPYICRVFLSGRATRKRPGRI